MKARNYKYVSVTRDNYAEKHNGNEFIYTLRMLIGKGYQTPIFTIDADKYGYTKKFQFKADDEILGEFKETLEKWGYSENFMTITDMGDKYLVQYDIFTAMVVRASKHGK